MINISDSRLPDKYLPINFTSCFPPPRFSPSLDSSPPPVSHRDCGRPATRASGHTLSDSIAHWSTMLMRGIEEVAFPLPPAPTKQDAHKIDEDHRSVWDDDDDDDKSVLTVFDYFDNALLGVDFDSSCLEALDDQLILHPTASFAAVCWADAVRDYSPDKPRKDWVALELRRFEIPESDDSDEDEEEDEEDADCRTYHEERTPSASLYHNPNSTVVVHDEVKIVSPIDSISKKAYPFLNYGPADDASFISFEPHFTTTNPKESVHDFPRPRRQKSFSHRGIERITTFCTRLVKSTSP